MENIVIVGVLNVPQSTNISQAKAFLKRGFNVIPINYRTVLGKYGSVGFKKLVEHVVDKNNPYLVLFCKCNGVDPEIVSMCSEKATTWLWNPDVINEQMPRYPEVVEHAKRSHFSSCTSQNITEYFKSQGVKNCHFIFDGLDTDLFKPVPPVDKFMCDISFIGSKLQHRDAIKKLLEDAGYNVKFFGNGYGGEVYNNEFSQVCCSSKYVLSINTIDVEGIYFSNRLLRLLGCKVCTLHFDPFDSLKTTFHDGKDLILFKTADDLITKLKYIKNIDEIAENGYKTVTEKYTWDNTIDNILKVIG